MTKLTTERLETIATWRETYGNGANVMIPAEEAQLMARQLLAYEQAAKNPVAFTEACEISNMNATGLYMRGFPDSKQGRNIPIYAAPVLPKQPELIGMKVSIDTGSDNIGHRLFGEIVGTSDSNGVPVLCIEVAENNADVTLADEGKTAKIVKAAEKLVRCKGRYHSEQNYRSLAALFGVTVPDLPPLPSDEVSVQPVIQRELRSFVTDSDIAALHRFAECCDDPESGGHDLEKEQVHRLEKVGALQRSGRISYITDFGDYLISATAPVNAQPVSEPYKLAKSPEACAWISDGEGLWLGDCGLTWTFFDDGPNENGLKYCPSCGKKVSFIAAPAQDSE